MLARSLATAAAAAPPPPALTLHVYDHCPFCIRVDLFLGWQGVPYTRALYGYGDMEGPTALTGKKQLPVLEYTPAAAAAGTAAGPPPPVRLPESLDIIDHLVAAGAWGLAAHGSSFAPAGD